MTHASSSFFTRNSPNGSYSRNNNSKFINFKVTNTANSYNGGSSSTPRSSSDSNFCNGGSSKSSSIMSSRSTIWLTIFGAPLWRKP